MKIFITFILLIIATFSFGQQTISGTLMHGGLQRSYILYVPAIYNAANPAPLVFNFHGLTSSATAQIFYGEFRPIADTAGFLLVVPQGTLNIQGDTYWNAGFGGGVDDVGFTEALLDDISLTYNVNQEMVYSTGMSNGGYMSYHLACSLSERFAAIASVTGAMTKGSPLSCSPQHPTPIMEIHGDADAIVPYLGNAVSESTQAGLDYWINFNNTNAAPPVVTLPNTNTTDNSTVEHHVYAGGDNCVDVEHYKILNGGHTWPGAPVNIGSGETNHDINASLLIWEFFLKYDINGKIGCITTEVNDIDTEVSEMSVYPNPTSNFLTLKWNESKEVTTIRIKDVLGKEVFSVPVNGRTQLTISTKKLKKGIYFSQIMNGSELVFIQKVVLK